MSVYDPATGKVLLANFASAEGMKADNTGKDTSELGDFWRTKTYVKPKDMVNPTYPVFPQPYQMAQALFGGTWNDFNKVFVVQVGKCNLDCWYCFVDKELREGKFGDWFDAYEVMDMWRESGVPICRISGGEPTLAPDFLVAMIGQFEDIYNYGAETGLLWIDTNLAGGPAFVNKYKKSAMALEYQPNVAISGCFKGFCESDAEDATGVKGNLLKAQFETAKALIEETDLEAFFYVPGITHKALDNPQGYIEEFFNRMRQEVDEYAPLRTYILEIKNYSPTETHQWGEWNAYLPGGCRPIDLWQQLCRKTYSPELLWLPNHQIQFKKRQ